MDGTPMITFTLWLDPQWELALADLIPQIERGITEGLIAESDVDEIIAKGAILPHVHILVDEK